jgi:hypothetical protein
VCVSMCVCACACVFMTYARVCVCVCSVCVCVCVCVSMYCCAFLCVRGCSGGKGNKPMSRVGVWFAFLFIKQPFTTDHILGFHNDVLPVPKSSRLLLLC